MIPNDDFKHRNYPNQFTNWEIPESIQKVLSIVANIDERRQRLTIPQIRTLLDGYLIRLREIEEEAKHDTSWSENAFLKLKTRMALLKPAREIEDKNAN